MKGSHNTLTFAAPRHWWWRLLTPCWRCQTKDIEQQIAVGVRSFDIRFVRKDISWLSAHGMVTLNIDPVETVRRINELCPNAYVRLILERGDEADKAFFHRLCGDLEESYPGLRFFGGYYKPTWEQLYEFKKPLSQTAERSYVQWCGSMQSRCYGKLLPLLWARRNNPPEIDPFKEIFPIVAMDDV